MGTQLDFSNADHAKLLADINGGAGGEPVVNVSDGWRALATELLRVQLDVRRAVSGIAETQEGASAEAATAATEPMVPWVSQAREIANQLAADVATQEEHFSWTKSNIPPVPDVYDPGFIENPGDWAAGQVDSWMPGLTTEQEKDQAAAQAEAQRAREVMTRYQSNSNMNLDARPAFEPAPTINSDVSSPGTGAVGSPGAGGGGGAAAAAAGGGGAGGAAGGGQAGAVSPVAATPQLAGPAAAGGGAGGSAGAGAVGTTPQVGGAGGEQAGRLPGAGGTAGGGAMPPFGGGGGGVAGGVGGAARGGAGRGGAGRGGATGRAAGGGGAGGAGRAGGGAGRAGGGAAGGFGPRGGGSTGGGFGPRGSGGPAGGALSGAADAASRGTGPAGAGGRGGAGAMGAGMAGGGAGGGRNQDSEHQRPSWLVEQDGTALTGTLPPTLPAGGVIGVEPPEDW